jgi:hypothetical protein
MKGHTVQQHIHLGYYVTAKRIKHRLKYKHGSKGIYQDGHISTFMTIHCRHKTTEDFSILVYDTVCVGIYVAAFQKSLLFLPYEHPSSWTTLKTRSAIYSQTVTCLVQEASTFNNAAARNSDFTLKSILAN